MNINDMKQSKYLKQEDIGQGKLVTINRLQQENMAQQGQDPEMKWVMYFIENIASSGENKGLAMAWTNIQLCAKVCESEDTDQWAGKQVVLYIDPNVSYAGKLTGGIRIRARQQQSTQAQNVATGDFNDPIPGFDDNTPPPTNF